jgi:flagellar biosynthesis/type III secretory pathway protein FliH
MGFHKDVSVQSLDIDSINDILRKSRDGNFRPRGFEQIPVDAPADAAMEEAGLGVPLQKATVAPGAGQDTATDTAATTSAAEPELSPEEEARQTAAHKVGYTEGFAEGYQKGLAEAPAPEPIIEPAPEVEAHLEETARLFTDLTRTLTDHAADHHTALRRAMEQTLLTLASDLAGQQIDALPAAFAQRVEELVDRVGKTVDCTQIHLNPEDLAAVAPALKGSDIIEGCILQADESLERGAVDIRSGPNRVQSALPEFEDGGLPADWDDSEILVQDSTT